MTDLEKAITAGGTVVETDLDRALKAGGTVVQEKRTPSVAESAGMGAVHGMTFGTAPAIAKFMTKLSSVLPDKLMQRGIKATTGADVSPEMLHTLQANPEIARDVYRAGEAEAREANPTAFTVGEVAGAAAVPIPGAGAAKGAGLAARAGKAALRGAGTGAAFGAGEAVGEGARAGDIAKRAAIGAGAGAVVGSGSEVVKSALTKTMGKLADKIRPSAEPSAPGKMHLPHVPEAVKKAVDKSPELVPIVAAGLAAHEGGEAIEDISHGHPIRGAIKGAAALAAAGTAARSVRAPMSNAIDRLRASAVGNPRAADLLVRITSMMAAPTGPAGTVTQTSLGAPQ